MGTRISMQEEQQGQTVEEKVLGEVGSARPLCVSPRGKGRWHEWTFLKYTQYSMRSAAKEDKRDYADQVFWPVAGSLPVALFRDPPA